MRLVPDEEAELWLEEFIPWPDNFDWDDGNSGKNAKHNVEDVEIEALLAARQFVFAGRIEGHGRGEWRGLLLGKAPMQRMLTLVFTQRDGRLRPISCRAMRGKERAYYEERQAQA